MSTSSASLLPPTSPKRKRTDAVMRGVLMAATGVALVPLILIIYYLLYKGLLAWTDKEHWSDFGAGCLKVAGVGAVSVLAPWLWGLFVN